MAFSGIGGHIRGGGGYCMIQLENGFKWFFDTSVNFDASMLLKDFFFIIISDSLDGGVGNSNPWGWVRIKDNVV